MLHNSNNVNAFLPIVLICCPSILKGKMCGCGYQGYYPANDFYKQQVSQSFGNGGSQGSGAQQSGSGAYIRGLSGSDPSNQQESGLSWRTTEANPLNFINLLNQVNTLADLVNRHSKNLEPNTGSGDNEKTEVPQGPLGRPAAGKEA